MIKKSTTCKICVNKGTEQGGDFFEEYKNYEES